MLTFRLPLRNAGLVFAACLVAFSISHAHGDLVDYQKQIQPLLQQHCYKCHGPETQESGIRFDRRSALLRGGDTGHPAIVPGDPTKSHLLAVLSPESEARMPPDGPYLTQAEIRMLKRWISEGANWPNQMHLKASDVTSDHWSLQQIKRAIPLAGTTVNPIDTLIDAQLEKAGLQRSNRADSITQLRRLHLVLTGLPPTPQDLQRFQDNPGEIDAAYAAAVERLLDSPH